MRTRYNKIVNENSDLLAQEIEKMANAAVNVNALSGAAVQNIDEMLADLDLDIELEAGNDEVEEIVEVEAAAEDADAVVEVMEESAEAEAEVEATHEELDANLDIDDLDIALARSEGYESQESDVQTVEDADQALADAKANKPARKKAASSTPRTPGVPRSTKSLPDLEPATFVLEGDASAMSATELDDAKAAVLAAVPSQKKIAEKYENLFQALAANKQPSVYVVGAFKLLEQKGEFTSAELVGAFKGSYSQGTAQSQAGQIMNLFDRVKIASRSGNKLTANPNSVVAAKIRKILADAAAAKSGS